MLNSTSHTISVLLVIKNERDFIEKAIESLIKQDYPNDGYEIIAVDGVSTDGTRQIVMKYTDEYSSTIRLIDNPKGTLSSGWNIGIKEAKGDIVIRIDGHSYVPRDFLRKNIAALNLVSDAGCVGGPIVSIGESFMPKLIAKVLSCPFGIGNSKFRYSEKAGYVDTIAYGAYRKQIFSRVGLFDESLHRNQDLDMHSRIRKEGWKFYLDPEIHSYYVVRSSLCKFIKQAFDNGFWVIHNLVKDKNSVSVRHLVPLVFLITLISLVAISFFSNWALLSLSALIGIYGLLNLLSTLYYATKHISVILLLPLLFFALHISYGAGSISAIASSVGKWLLR